VGWAIFGAYSWAGFPFDNACDTAEEISDSYVGAHTAYTGDDEEVTFSLSAGDVEYFFCSQDMIRFKPVAFPALPSYQRDGEEWMTDEQDTIVKMYGWAGIAILSVAACLFLKRIVINVFMKVFCRTYRPQGKDMQYGFSEVQEIFGYIPSIKVPGFPYPLLACDLRGIQDMGLIGWSDPTSPYSEHNLVYDVPKAAERISSEGGETSRAAGISDENSRVFHIVKEWPYEPNNEQDEKYVANIEQPK